MGFRWVYIV